MRFKWFALICGLSSQLGANVLMEGLRLSGLTEETFFHFYEDPSSRKKVELHLPSLACSWGSCHFIGHHYLSALTDFTNPRTTIAEDLAVNTPLLGSVGGGLRWSFWEFWFHRVDQDWFGTHASGLLVERKSRNEVKTQIRLPLSDSFRLQTGAQIGSWGAFQGLVADRSEVSHVSLSSSLDTVIWQTLRFVNQGKNMDFFLDVNYENEIPEQSLWLGGALSRQKAHQVFHWNFGSYLNFHLPDFSFHKSFVDLSLGFWPFEGNPFVSIFGRADLHSYLLGGTLRLLLLNLDFYWKKELEKSVSNLVFPERLIQVIQMRWVASI